MGAIIRLAKNEGKIGSDILAEGQNFLKLYFDDYLKTNYTNPETSRFNVRN